MAAANFFANFPATRVSSVALDGVLAAAPGLTVLFLWGLNCPNCEVAKRAMLVEADRLAWPALRWLHCNVYEDEAMATRFALHGIPVFLVFRGPGRPAGRITGWPGTGRFAATIDRQLAAVAAEA